MPDPHNSMLPSENRPQYLVVPVTHFTIASSTEVDTAVFATGEGRGNNVDEIGKGGVGDQALYRAVDVVYGLVFCIKHREITAAVRASGQRTQHERNIGVGAAGVTATGIFDNVFSK